MIKIILNGCNGKMGQVISRLVEQDDECRIVAGFDIVGEAKNGYPVYTNPGQPVLTAQDDGYRDTIAPEAWFLSPELHTPISDPSPELPPTSVFSFCCVFPLPLSIAPISELSLLYRMHHRIVTFI